VRSADGDDQTDPQSWTGGESNQSIDLTNHDHATTTNRSTSEAAFFSPPPHVCMPVRTEPCAIVVHVPNMNIPTYPSFAGLSESARCESAAAAYQTVVGLGHACLLAWLSLMQRH